MIKTGDISALAVFLFYAMLVMAVFSISSKMLRRTVVIASVVIINIGLFSSLVAAAGRTDAFSTIDAFNIPGGTALLIYRGQNPNPDLIISGLLRKPYPIDERIFGSAFNEIGVERLGKVFVMSAEYGAIDDIFRLCQFYRADSLFVDSRIKKSFSDISNSLFSDQRTIKIESFPGKHSIKNLSGYYPSENMIELVFDNSAILILNEKELFEPNKFSLSKPTLVIYGGRKKIARSEIESLIESESMLQQLVCSRTEQQNTGLLAPFKFDSKVTDMEQAGSLRIILKERTDSSFQVSPL